MMNNDAVSKAIFDEMAEKGTLPKPFLTLLEQMWVEHREIIRLRNYEAERIGRRLRDIEIRLKIDKTEEAQAQCQASIGKPIGE